MSKYTTKLTEQQKKDYGMVKITDHDLSMIGLRYNARRDLLLKSKRGEQREVYHQVSV